MCAFFVLGCVCARFEILEIQIMWLGKAMGVGGSAALSVAVSGRRRQNAQSILWRGTAVVRVGWIEAVATRRICHIVRLLLLGERRHLLHGNAHAGISIVVVVSECVTT